MRTNEMNRIETKLEKICSENGIKMPIYGEQYEAVVGRIAEKLDEISKENMKLKKYINDIGK